MKNFFFNTIKTAAAATVLLAGTVNAQTHGNRDSYREPLPSATADRYTGGDRAYTGGDRSYTGGDRAYTGGDRAYTGGDRAYTGGDRAYTGDPRWEHTRMPSWEARMIERRRYLRDREHDIDHELAARFLSPHRRRELIRERHRIHDELKHISASSFRDRRW